MEKSNSSTGVRNYPPHFLFSFSLWAKNDFYILSGWKNQKNIISWHLKCIINSDFDVHFIGHSLTHPRPYLRATFVLQQWILVVTETCVPQRLKYYLSLYRKVCRPSSSYKSRFIWEPSVVEGAICSAARREADSVADLVVAIQIAQKGQIGCHCNDGFWVWLHQERELDELAGSALHSGGRCDCLCTQWNSSFFQPPHSPAQMSVNVSTLSQKLECYISPILSLKQFSSVFCYPMPMSLCFFLHNIK